MRIANLIPLLALPLLFGCARDGQTAEQDAPPNPPAIAESAGYTDISVSELDAMLAEKDFALVNVHVPFEGDLPHTDLSIPFDEIENHLDQLPADRDAPIVLYCRSGRMSVIAAADLARLGYTNVSQLAGGFLAWTAAGLPLAGE